MLIENKTGFANDTQFIDDDGGLLKYVSKVDLTFEANQIITAEILCLRPTIKATINGRIKFNTTAYTRQQKEALIKQLELELNSNTGCSL